MTNAPSWQDLPEAHDYLAASSYLQLVLPGARVNQLAAALEQAKISHFKAKDILRASGLLHLTPENAHVAKDLKKVANKEALVPILLVRGDATKGHPLMIADGYHRVCAVLHLDENIDVPCKIVDL